LGFLGRRWTPHCAADFIAKCRFARAADAQAEAPGCVSGAISLNDDVHGDFDELCEAGTGFDPAMALGYRAQFITFVKRQPSTPFSGRHRIDRAQN
jgi:hypothetical protein